MWPSMSGRDSISLEVGLRTLLHAKKKRQKSGEYRRRAAGIDNGWDFVTHADTLMLCIPSGGLQENKLPALTIWVERAALGRLINRKNRRAWLSSVTHQEWPCCPTQYRPQETFHPHATPLHISFFSSFFFLALIGLSSCTPSPSSASCVSRDSPNGSMSSH